MNMSFSHDMDDEYEKLIRRMNPPRVVNNNESCKNATVIRIDSAKKHGILLEVVQILTDTKAVKPIYLLMAIGSWMDENAFFADYTEAHMKFSELLGHVLHWDGFSPSKFHAHNTS